MRETPGYIPNPEAKPLSADGTAGGTLWESRTPPDFFYRNGHPTLGGHFALTARRPRGERSLVLGEDQGHPEGVAFLR